MSNCNICTEKYNKVSRSMITCVYCDFIACKTCCKKYILGTFKLAHCMNCTREWSREILVKNFSISFVENDYKKHYENLLFNKESLLFPATQLHIENESKKSILINQIYNISTELIYVQNKMDILRNENMSLQNKIYNFVNNRNLSNESQVFISKYNNNVTLGKQYVKQYEDMFLQRNILKMELDTLSSVLSVYVKKCSFTNCRGFLSTDFKCSLCGNYTCESCHAIKGYNNNIEHTCHNDDIETVKLIQKDTKGCPTCGTGISKIEGCDQMYCVQCHTAFSWTTGKIELGKVHNPHYYAFMRNNGHDRNLNDLQCGREIDDNFIKNILNTIKEKNISKQYENLLHICNNIILIRNKQLPIYNIDIVNTNLDLRVNFLKNIISKETFTKNLYKKEKHLQHYRAIATVLAMYINTMTDIIYRIFNDIKNNIDVTDYLLEFNMLKEYTNECLIDISKIYKSKPITLGEN